MPAGDRLAAELAALDPGALVGGNTIIGTGNGTVLFGVPHRPNFIIAVGSNETIVGGNGDDQLGAIGKNTTIFAGRGMT